MSPTASTADSAFLRIVDVVKDFGGVNTAATFWALRDRISARIQALEI